MKRAVALISVAILILSATTSTADQYSRGSSTPGEMAWRFYNPDPFTAPSQVQFMDSISRIPWDTNIPNKFTQVFPVCDSTHTDLCIESVEGRIGDSAWEALTPGIELHAKPYSAGVPNDMRDAPAGASFPRVWTAPASLATKGGNTYLVSANTNGTELHFGISAYKITETLNSQPNGTCPWSYTEVECGVIYNYPANSEFRMKVRIGTILGRVTPWMYARASNPSVDIASENGKTVMTVTGTPMYIPTAHAVMSVDEIISNFPYINRATFNDPPRFFPLLGLDANDFDSYKKIEAKVDKQSMGELSSWHFDSRPARGASFSCFMNLALGLGGLVVTNAAIYNSNPPTWDETSGSLNFEVASPHLLSNGETSVGEYRLIINTQVAKCLWPSSASNPRAEVTITDSDGTKSISTSVVKVQGNFMYLSVAGFHYSRPTIGIKVLGDTPAAKPTPSPSASTSSTSGTTNGPITAEQLSKLLDALMGKQSPSPTPSPASTAKTTTKTTITCAKGKVSKKVTALKPTCPKGFTKKA